MLRSLAKTLAALCGGMALTLAAHAAGDYPPQPIAKEEHCPVCGMFPANYPKWHAQVVFKDGKHASFDSAADMFRFLNHMGKYDPKHAAKDIGKIYVPDHGNGNWLDAERAFFVQGSSAKGPMGNDLPAFASKEAAAGFSGKAGGKVLGFRQVTPAVVEGLRGEILRPGNDHAMSMH